MDEVDIIQNYLISQAGEHSDVILGLGYDHALGAKIGITLIATGFEHRDPFSKKEVVNQEPKKEEKIVMTLGVKEEEKKMLNQTCLPFEEKKKESIVEDLHVELPNELQASLIENEPDVSSSIILFTNEQPTYTGGKLVDKSEPVEKIELVFSSDSDQPQKNIEPKGETSSPSSAAS